MPNITIVTIDSDIKTIEVCNKNKVNVITYNCCFCQYDKTIVKNPEKLFHLSKMINQGLMYTYEQYPNNWTLYLNSDVILYPEINNVDLNSLDTECLYGCTRVNVSNQSELESTYKNGKADLSSYNTNAGEVGIGFFQLWKSHIFYDQKYVNNNVVNYDASWSDMLFIKKFKSVITIPNYKVLHLGVPGVNWYGRKSETWK